MRRTLVCVLMTSLLLLTGCSAGGGVSEAEQEALLIRNRYLAMTGCTAEVHVTADYGQRIYEYDFAVETAEEETRITVTGPETVAGITARLTGEGSFLEYEDLVLETGPLDDSGLTPVSAVPVLLDAARSGFICAASFPEEGAVRVDCTDPEAEPGQGRSVSLWFDRGTCGLLRGELSMDGRLLITCTFHDFTMR